MNTPGPPLLEPGARDMRRLGNIRSVTRDGVLVVKPVELPSGDYRGLVGAIVYDSSSRRIGRIVDLIGRVESPYVVVRAESRAVLDEIEEPLYYYKPKPPRRRGRGKRGGRKSPRKPRRIHKGGARGARGTPGGKRVRGKRGSGK